MKFRHRVIVITGASAGVSRATTRAFAREEARIGLIARDTMDLKERRATWKNAAAKRLFYDWMLPMLPRWRAQLRKWKTSLVRSTYG